MFTELLEINIGLRSNKIAIDLYQHLVSNLILKEISIELIGINAKNKKKLLHSKKWVKFLRNSVFLFFKFYYKLNEMRL